MLDLKKHIVSVKALKDIEITNIGLSVFRKNKLMMEAKKEITASGFSRVPYLSFIEKNKTPFTLKTENKSKNWDGTLEYSRDTQNWSEWDGTEISSSNDGKLYLRGTGNSKITGNTVGSRKQFVLTDNKRIQCLGNIENLLDYKTVEAGNHPVMADYCYEDMFWGCKSLNTAPELPATTLTGYCYAGMFSGCISLTKAPKLPATTLTDCCYTGMFQSASITKAPELPATTLTRYCYSRMFSYCTYLTEVPELPATTLVNGCYSSMFQNCKSLTGSIHCPASTADDLNRLDANAQIPANTATVVYDL